MSCRTESPANALSSTFKWVGISWRRRAMVAPHQPPPPRADWIIPAMTRAERTMARPARALIIAALPVSIWRGLPEADMYMKAPHIRKKAATVTPTPTPTLSRLVKSPLICCTWVTPEVSDRYRRWRAGLNRAVGGDGYVPTRPPLTNRGP